MTPEYNKAPPILPYPGCRWVPLEDAFPNPEAVPSGLIIAWLREKAEWRSFNVGITKKTKERIDPVLKQVRSEWVDDSSAIAPNTPLSDYIRDGKFQHKSDDSWMGFHELFLLSKDKEIDRDIEEAFV